MPELYTFGDGTKGQLGHAGGKKEKVSFKSPARVDTSGPMHGLSCGHFHSLALSQDGAVYSWGSGVMGLLGHGDEEEWEGEDEDGGDLVGDEQERRRDEPRHVGIGVVCVTARRRRCRVQREHDVAQ